MAHRIFRDADGAAWQAWDTRPSSASSVAVAPGFGGGWLSFERFEPEPSGAAPERRRLAPAPPGWERLADRELRALLERATTTAARDARQVPPPRSAEP